MPFALCIWLMFTDFGLSEGISKIYYILVGVAYYTCMTLLDVPYTDLGAEMTKDYDERSSLANYRNVFSQVAWSMIPDCVELDELETGKRREGIFYASATFIQKVATALAMLMAGFMFHKIGYAADVEITQSIIDGLRKLFAFGSSIPLIFSAVVVLFTPMTRERHEKLVQVIALRKEGKEFNLDGLEKLLGQNHDNSKAS